MRAARERNKSQREKKRHLKQKPEKKGLKTERGEGKKPKNRVWAAPLHRSKKRRHSLA